MDNSKKIKVAWVCHFSNPVVRKYVLQNMNPVVRLMRKVLKGASLGETDFAVWVTNAIHEFESFDNVELHVIFPNGYVTKSKCIFEYNGIVYHCVKDERSYQVRRFLNKIGISQKCQNDGNARAIVDEVNEICPDIIHYIGAENLNYSLSILNIPQNIPTIVSLQTLLISTSKKSDIKIEPILNCEKQVLERADFLATGAKEYADFLNANLSQKKVLNITLALAEQTFTGECDKQFDFVYFSSNISKAVDWAIEAFAIAYRTDSSLTLDIIGGYDEQYKQRLDCRLKELNIAEAVKFEGSLPSHDDVISQIRKSRFALLPLKIDLISGTIREALANGIPVVTTITEGTPLLNEKKQTALLSPRGDFQAMADNMLKLVNQKQLQDELRENGFAYMQDKKTNRERMEEWVLAYYSCIDNYKNETPIPTNLLYLEK